MVRPSEADTQRYFGYSKKEAERIYRQKYGLVGKKVNKIAYLVKIMED